MGQGVLAGHFGGDAFDVLLAADVDAGDAREVDDGEVGTVVGVDPQLYGVVDDLPALPRHVVSQLLDVAPHLPEVQVLLPRTVVLEHRVGLFLRLP